MLLNAAMEMSGETLWSLVQFQHFVALALVTLFPMSEKGICCNVLVAHLRRKRQCSNQSGPITNLISNLFRSSVAR